MTKAERDVFEDKYYHLCMDYDVINDPPGPVHYMQASASLKIEGAMEVLEALAPEFGITEQDLLALRHCAMAEYFDL